MRQGLVVLAVLLLCAAGFGLFLTLAPSSPPPDASVDAPGEPDASAAPVEPAAPTPDRPTASAGPAPAPPPADPPSSPAARPRPTTPPEDVSLTVDADVPGAQVFVDRQFVGTTPLTQFGIQPGRRQINVAAPGYDSHAESRDLSPGHHEIMVRFREVRLDARVDVVHDHRIGECRGTLVAGPEGLRYETEGDDAFRAALTEIDELQVDYLAGRLQVRAGGRRYEFTHAGGSADRLLQFQRDVNRARERLLAGHVPAR